MVNLYKKLKVHVVSDCCKDSDLDFNDIIILDALDLLSHYESLKECSSVLFNKKRLTATSEGKLLSLRILNENITWEELILLNDIRKSYSEY